MKTPSWCALVAAVAPTFLACGGDGAQGSGNGVLKVACEVHYTPMANSARSAAADSSQAVAQVWRAGQPVTDAVVTLVDLDRDETLALTDKHDQKWLGSWAGYRQRLALHVSAGDDFVTCELTGPSRHVISQPTPGALFHSGRDLKVAWRRDPADTKEAPKATPGDSTECRLGSGFLAVSPDAKQITLPQAELEPGAETVEVVWRRQLSPTGAAAGSLFTIGYGVTVPFVLH